MLADVCVLTVKLLSSIFVYSIIGISHKALLPIDSFMYTTAALAHNSTLKTQDCASRNQ